MDAFLHTNSTFRKIQIFFTGCGTLIAGIFILLFQSYYSTLHYNPRLPGLSHRNMDRTQTQFEYEDDKHLYLYDVPWFMNKSIIIAGMVHNVEDRIEPLLQSLNEIYCIFNNTIFFIFESNSNDETPKLLHKWSLNKQINPFCDRHRINTNRKRINVRGQRHQTNRKWIHSIQQHKPSLVDKLLIFNDSIVANSMRKLQTMLGNNKTLNRIERYVVYRNMMLEQIRSIKDKYEQSPWHISFDYLMLMDMDLFDVDKRMLFNELHYSPTQVMCANGVVYLFDLMYDIFASVLEDGTWMHSMAFEPQKWKQKRDFRMTHFPLKRYEAMRSCFGGVAVYKSLSKMLATDCKYQLVLSESRRMNGTDEYVMENPDEELQHLANQYEIWMHSDERICEHLSFNYCLRKHGYTISIAKNAKAHYSKRQVVIPSHNPLKKKGKLNKRPTLGQKDIKK
eukprot:20630_1